MPNVCLVKPKLRLYGYLGLIAVITAVSIGVWTVAYRNALHRLQDRAEVDLVFAADRLTSHLLRYRELAVALSQHPHLIPLLHENKDPKVAKSLLQNKGDKSGAFEIDLIDLTGAVLVSNLSEHMTVDLTSKPVQRAFHGALGKDSQIIPSENSIPTRAYIHAAPVFAKGSGAIGAVVVSTSLVNFEQNWPTSPTAVYFTDQSGQVVSSNRTELILKQTTPNGGFPQTKLVDSWTGLRIWMVQGGPYLPSRALVIEKHLPVIDLTATILMDAAPARATAYLQAMLVAALGLVFGAGLYLAGERRRVLAERLEAEAAVNTMLEIRVAERTRALSTANTNLRHEVKERKEAESALKQAQAELVQAGKLSALGKMSAGISHELNQPLMAIRSFSENAGKFLDMGKEEEAQKNLGRISELSWRMAKIIKNLRAFARQESAPFTKVDLVEVIEASIEICAETLRKQGVSLDWQAPMAPVWVQGGEVRLQQVVVNLMSNAADAMEDSATRSIALTLEATDDTVVLHVADTGPGIKEPERVFDPFYSTKQVGAGDGMGLGLSISYGLVQSFGGAIHGRNGPNGGAIFTVELQTAKQKDAAE